jgi:hypothetical protein
MRMGDINTLSAAGEFAAEGRWAGYAMAGQDWCRDLAVCSHCSQVVPAAGGGGGAAGVLLDTPCPRCGEEAMRVSETGVWD